MGPESGARDADYVQRAMSHYAIDTRLPFKLHHCWEILKDHLKWQEIAIPNFNAGSEGGSKRHESTGFSSFNTESEEASINLNTNVDDNNEDEDALAMLMVTEMIAQEKQERLAFLDIKRREVECREQEIEQQDMMSKDDSVRDKGSWENRVWVWKWDWGRIIRGRVCNELDDLVCVLLSVVVCNTCRDRWKWTLFDDGVFKNIWCEAKEAIGSD
nr:hypothetical protein [Tanacetum cinerariifolium]